LLILATLVQAKSPIGVTGPRRLHPTSQAPLSEEDCKNVGGEVRNGLADTCTSGKYCRNTDSKGVTRINCIQS